MDSGLDIGELTAVYKLLGDETRLRVLALLQDNELAVGEIQKVLGIGQSTLSSQLALMKEQDLVAGRKEGQKVFYRIPLDPSSRKLALLREALASAAHAKWHARDRRHLEKTLRERAESSREFFNRQAVQNMQSPGQTWQALAHGLITLIHGHRIVDLGCGSGRLARQFAASGNAVTGVDSSEEQIRLAKADKIETNSAGRDPEYRLASMESTGLPAMAFDLALLSQSLHHAANPAEVIREAHRLLAPGGKLLILDLLAHEADWMRSKFGDFWLGFSEADLKNWVSAAGFSLAHFEITPPSPEYPDLEGVMVVGVKS
jgi:ubiquinone/menaquinone biosynthesis C-methylase UbiE/DNA-binding transcriptional ArsR family regulator